MPDPETEGEIWAYWQRGLLSTREVEAGIAAARLAALAPPRYQALVAMRVRRLLGWQRIAGEGAAPWGRLVRAIVSEVTV